jgi:hypothetical protein
MKADDSTLVAINGKLDLFVRERGIKQQSNRRSGERSGPGGNGQRSLIGQTGLVQCVFDPIWKRHFRKQRGMLLRWTPQDIAVQARRLNTHPATANVDPSCRLIQMNDFGHGIKIGQLRLRRIKLHLSASEKTSLFSLLQKRDKVTFKIEM